MRQDNIMKYLIVAWPKRWNKISRKKHYPNCYKELFLIPNLKFQMKL